MKSIHKIYAECAGMVKGLGYDFPTPEIKVNTRSTTRWGCIKWRASGPVLELAADLLDDNVDDYPAYHTCLHEIGHLVAGPGEGHGPTWKAIMESVGNAYGYTFTRCSDYSKYGLRVTKEQRYKWQATCTKCGYVYYRNRRRKGTLFCGKPDCTGRLTAWEPTNPPALTAPVVVAANEQEPAGKVVRFNGKEYRVNV